MSDEQGILPSACVTRYVDDKLHALEKLLDERREAVRREEELHRRNLEIHLDSLNGEAGRLKAAADKTISIDNYNGAHNLLVEKLGALREMVVTDVSVRAGEARHRAERATWIALAALLIGILDLVIHWGIG